MFTISMIGRKTATIAIVLAAILGSASVLAGRATGLPHYPNNATAVSPAPGIVSSPSGLSSAERISKLENEILMLRVCLRDMTKVGAFRCVL